ncbi:lytic transglycosylase F [Echinicola pacifica]|uniref:Lytic transglycosylase F n=1 Tax=Echinicola pacifica TaxID=346377 RepID=A0A918PU28_9BACT|nr:transporter substrate-binding domain-containing protein [Echinicola pacifica]GGZ22777.1 lytic transglycosylase F [Echinicola pacifica]
MRYRLILLSALSLLLLAWSCNSVEERKKPKPPFWESPVTLDLEAIQKRGFIRAVVDNSSTSYYIYRGRRMGYEYELLRNLAKQLDVQLRIIVNNDIDRAFYLLNTGRADIIALNLVRLEEREKYGNFTHKINALSSVVVQRDNQKPITDIKDLHNKTVTVRKSAIYKDLLQAWEDSLNISINIIEENKGSDELVDDVIREEIEYTVVDEDVALVNSTYYHEMRMGPELTDATPVAWMVRKNSPNLLKSVNKWIDKGKQSTYFAILYGKYFLNKKNSYHRNISPFSSISGDRISVYDDLIKKGSDYLGWDWRLLASLVYKESRFDTVATSYAGAKGLLQLMPVTLERFGVTNPNDPYQSLMGGVRYLKYLDKFWMERVPETNERIKFILASYNVGHGHVNDAWRLSLKFGKDTQRWNDVAYYLERKSKPKYYQDPVVRSGYAKGHLAVAYVQDILSIYESYRVLVNP